MSSSPIRLKFLLPLDSQVMLPNEQAAPTGIWGSLLVEKVLDLSGNRQFPIRKDIRSVHAALTVAEVVGFDHLHIMGESSHRGIDPVLAIAGNVAVRNGEIISIRGNVDTVIVCIVPVVECLDVGKRFRTLGCGHDPVIIIVGGGDFGQCDRLAAARSVQEEAVALVIARRRTGDDDGPLGGDAEAVKAISTERVGAFSVQHTHIPC